MENGISDELRNLSYLIVFRNNKIRFTGSAFLYFAYNINKCINIPFGSVDVYASQKVRRLRDSVFCSYLLTIFNPYFISVYNINIFQFEIEKNTSLIMFKYSYMKY